MDPLIEVELRKDFLEKVDDMSHENLKRIVKACVWNLQEATELVKCEEETSGGHIDDENLRDVIQGLLAQLQQYRSEHLGYTDAMIKLQKQNQECIERLHAASNLCWETDVSHKKSDFDHDIVFYYKTLTESLMKTIHELQESLKARTLQWQVTLNLYLKEKYEGGHNLTTLETIAKDKYTEVYREMETKRERGREWKGEYDLSGLRYFTWHILNKHCKSWQNTCILSFMSSTWLSSHWSGDEIELKFQHDFHYEAHVFKNTRISKIVLKYEKLVK